MKMKNILILLLTAALAAAILLIAALYMKRDSDAFDSRHPALEDPLESLTVFSGKGDEGSGEAGKKQTESISPESQASPAPAESTSVTFPRRESDETETGMSEQDRILPRHHIIFVGDSRTLGMQNAIHKLMPDLDSCVFVGKVGEGCSWFLQEGQAQMAEAIRQYPDDPVVLNFGVNDPDQISQYLDAYRGMIASFPDTDFRFLSVNPVQRAKMIENGDSEEALALVTNSNISLLNDAIRNAFPDRYLDSSAMLKTTGFETVDGIHFTQQTYLKIHRFVAESLFS